jgi:hypothetical protein
MSMRSLSALLSAALLAGAAAAQTIWTPNGYAAVPGNSNNTYPWNRGSAPIHLQQIYSSANFTLQGLTSPVRIARLRFRAQASFTSWGGGSWPNVVLNMSTAAVSYTAPSTTFASNHGPDLTNIYTGQVTVLPGAGNGSTGPIYVDINLASPFLYDPSAGDLCLEVINDGLGWSGSSTPCDAVSGQGGAGGPPLSARVYNPSSTTVPTGTVNTDFGRVTQFVLVGGNAATISYGVGCNGLTLAVSARPVLGTTISLVTSGIPAGTLLGATVFSNIQHDPGIDLSSIGMPGCRQYVDLDVSRIFLVSAASGSVPQTIPNSSSFAGVHVYCQSATFSAGFVPLGVIASNGLTLLLDVL